ncbi:MAG: FAD-binding oxidoreductase [Propionibacteriaceae bacterium]|jgi:FAD/FMN-containing dehydrogenase/Fe-S oxidoreductase|nr:FAD-binding oxidoreductase [Propionibacteriaceae bacterium]
MTSSAALRQFISCLDPKTAASVSLLDRDRALYSSDASIYRLVPQAVASPRHRDELLELLTVAREAELPITARGSGTSCAGNAIGPGLVLDLRRHLSRIHLIDGDRQLAVVDPGVIQADLQRACQPYGLRFGPDPSTSSRCTIGGIVGNNACGPRALGYGVAASNLLDAEVITGRGDILRLAAMSGDLADSHPLSRALAALTDQHLALIRRHFGTFSRQVSGYGLQYLLPEKGRNLPAFFTGSEGTLGIASELTVRLVKDPDHRLTIALGYPSMADAADDVMAILPFKPTAVEGMDARLVEIVARAKGPAAVPPLPHGNGWTFVELAGDDLSEVESRSRQLLQAAGAIEGWLIDQPDQASAIWQIRSDGAGLAGVSLDSPAYPGWEDAAVPPSRLGEYLRSFEQLLDDFGFHALPYGHFGEGCVHARIDFPLTQPGGADRYRQFVIESARLVARLGGSLSGEHGDGRARSELLPIMYPPAALELFAATKSLFDPKMLLNPGVIVNPSPVDDQIRYAGLIDNSLVVSHQHFADQVHRCSGVGKCVASQAEGLMCPSFQATRQEIDSTRGRARILQEMLLGQLVDGWDSPAVAQALDLCLGCKGCASDCPTAVDMTSAKSYALNQRYRRRLRPSSHYLLGWLPRWGRLLTRLHLGWLVNALLGLPGIGAIGKWSAGVDRRRPLPRFASVSARRAARRSLNGAAIESAPLASNHPAASVTRQPTDTAPTGEHPTTETNRQPVLVWVDSFTDCFESTSLPAVIALLLDAGYAPQFLERTACCGLTWITTGQADGARRQIMAALDQLAPYAQAGTPILGLEPSCLAVWRDDAADLVDDSRVAQVAASTFTLAELLNRTDGWRRPNLTGHTVLAQPHCHQASVLGWGADAQLLKDCGASLVTIQGCCGLAGNFGVEIGHHDLSVAIAGQHLLPALEQYPEAVVLADGFSCRKQITDLTDRVPMTLAELLLAHRGID